MEAAWRAALDRAYSRGTRAVPAEPDDGRWTKLGTTKAAVVNATRRTLVDAAGRRVCVGWHTLAAAAGPKPTDLSDRLREAVLVAVDSPTSPDGVLLSSLVVASEHTPVP